MLKCQLKTKSDFILTGQALKPEANSIWISMKNFFKKLYITKLKGFRVDEMCVATILMEGTLEVFVIFKSCLFPIFKLATISVVIKNVTIL